MENFDDTGNPHEDTRAARYPEGQGDPLPSTPDRPFTKRLGRLALPLLLIALTGFTAYNTLQVAGVLHAQFPNSQTFSLGVAYSFAGPNAGSVLLPGSTGNVTLTIVSALNVPQTLQLSFNATDASDWSQPFASGVCPGSAGTLTMTLNGQMLVPINAPVPSGQNCQSFQHVTVTASPGTNQFLGTISVSPSATSTTVFTLTWFADQ